MDVTFVISIYTILNESPVGAAEVLAQDMAKNGLFKRWYSQITRAVIITGKFYFDGL